MKNSALIILVALAAMLTTCKKDAPYLITYPKSFPIIDTAVIAQSTITYGDSISVKVSLSDKVTPLSTLVVQVVVNNDVVVSETIRTKGNQSTIIRKYGVPFVPNRPDNADVKVYLSSINLDGWITDTILTTCKAKRPVINGIWLVPNSGLSYKFALTDSVNSIYFVKGMNFGTSVSFWLATKVDKFKKVDWSGLVFGKVGDGIGLITEGTDENRIITTDGTLTGISEMTFDALQFTATPSGKLLEPVKTLDINADLVSMIMASKNFKGGNVYFGEGVEVTFTGLTNLANQLPPDYFEITGPNTAIFLGKTALYKAYFYIDGGYLYVEPQPEVQYPDAMWMDGTGFGRPSIPYETSASWNWNSSFDYAPCRYVSPGVYQVTVYGNNTDNGSGWGTFDFKFFWKRGWWDAPGVHIHEIDASTYTITSTAPFVGRASDGNVNGSTTPFSGVFKITVDQNTKTITLVKIN